MHSLGAQSGRRHGLEVTGRLQVDGRKIQARQGLVMPVVIGRRHGNPDGIRRVGAAVAGPGRSSGSRRRGTIDTHAAIEAIEPQYGGVQGVLHAAGALHHHVAEVGLLQGLAEAQLLLLASSLAILQPLALDGIPVLAAEHQRVGRRQGVGLWGEKVTVLESWRRSRAIGTHAELNAVAGEGSKDKTRVDLVDVERLAAEEHTGRLAVGAAVLALGQRTDQVIVPGNVAGVVQAELDAKRRGGD